jgi:tetratricopeptide (TPR) repeat protein
MSLLGRLFHREGMADYRRGIIQFNNGDFTSAIECFERTLVVVRNPTDPYHSLSRFYAAEAHAKLGLALARNGDLGRAASEFRSAIGCGYRYPDLHVRLAGILERLGDPAGAERECLAALAIHPAYHDARACMGIALVSLGRLDEARALLEDLHERGYGLPPGLPWEAGGAPPPEALSALRDQLDRKNRSSASLQRALDSYDRGDLQMAIEELEEAVEEQPRYADLHCRLGALLIEAGKVERALEELKAALEIHPRYVEARLQSGIAWLRLGDPEKAVEHLEVAYDQAPDYPDVLLFLGLALLRDGALSRASALLTETVERLPRFAGGHYGLALVRLVEGATDESIALLRGALACDPNFSRAQLDLGDLLLRRGEAAEAASRFRGILEKEKTHARQALAKAFAADPKDPIARALADPDLVAEL